MLEFLVTVQSFKNFVIARRPKADEAISFLDCFGGYANLCGGKNREWALYRMVQGGHNFLTFTSVTYEVNK